MNFSAKNLPCLLGTLLTTILISGCPQTQNPTDSQQDATNSEVFTPDAMDIGDTHNPTDVTDINTPQDITDAMDGSDTPDIVSDSPDGSDQDVLPPLDAGYCLMVSGGALSETGGMLSDNLNAQGSGQLEAYQCALGADLGERVHHLSVTQPRNVRVRVQSTDPELNTTVAIRSVCSDPASEIACNDDDGITTNSTVYTRLDPGEYDVIVDGYTPASMQTPLAYTVSVDSEPIADNAICSGAISVTPSMGLTNQRFGAASSGSTLCNPLSQGRVLYYSVSIPPEQSATVTVTPTAGDSWTAVVSALESCASTTCAGTTIGTNTLSPVSISMENRSTLARVAVVQVSSTQLTTDGVFRIGVVLNPLSMPSANAVCTAATDLNLPAFLQNERLSTGVDNLAGRCLAQTTGPTLYYGVNVPAGQTLVAGAASVTGDIALRILQDCMSNTCLASGDLAQAAQSEITTYRNRMGSDQRVIIALSAHNDLSVGDASLSVRVDGPASNTTCNQAITLSGGDQFYGENAARGDNDLSSSCLPNAHGGALFYRIVVPVGQRLRATVIPLSGWNPTLRLLGNCPESMCVASVDANTDGMSETIEYVNNDPNNPTINIAVSAVDPNTVGLFDLLVDVGL